MMYDLTPEQWSQLSKTEKKIVVLIKKYKIEDEEKRRLLLGWPLEPMSKRTYQNHWNRLVKKIAQFRAKQERAT